MKYSNRRNGVCYQSGDAIRYVLRKLNNCDCGCHSTCDNSSSRDSVVSRHCLDCDDVRANDPEVMLQRQEQLSRNNSTISSGYGSEAGSMYLSTPTMDDDNFPGFDFSILGRRSSVPRKSSTGTIRAKSSFQHRCSVPSRPHVLREYADEEEIVFV